MMPVSNTKKVVFLVSSQYFVKTLKMSYPNEIQSMILDRVAELEFAERMEQIKIELPLYIQRAAEATHKKFMTRIFLELKVLYSCLYCRAFIGKRYSWCPNDPTSTSQHDCHYFYDQEQNYLNNYYYQRRDSDYYDDDYDDDDDNG